MLVCEQMILAVLVIAVAFGAVTEFQMVAVRLCPSADGALVPRAGCRTVHLLAIDLLAVHFLVAVFLHVSCHGKENDEVHDGHQCTHRRRKVGRTDEDAVFHRTENIPGEQHPIQHTKPLGFHRDDEKQQEFHIRVLGRKGHEQGQVQVIGRHGEGDARQPQRKIRDKRRQNVADDAHKEIHVEPERAPLVFQLSPDHIIQIQGKYDEQEITAGRIHEEGHQPPDLPVQDRPHIQAQVRPVHRRCKVHDEETAAVQHNDVKHQIVNGVFPEFPFHFI